MITSLIIDLDYRFLPPSGKVVVAVVVVVVMVVVVVVVVVVVAGLDSVGAGVVCFEYIS